MTVRNDEDSESSWLALSFFARFIHDPKSIHLKDLSLKITVMNEFGNRC